MKPQTKLVIAAVCDTIAKGYVTGAYARNALGARTGLHSIDATGHDFAASLWLACEKQQAGFDSLFNAFRTWTGHDRHKDGTVVTSSQFCNWLDTKTQNWHMAQLTRWGNDLPYVKLNPAGLERQPAAVPAAAKVRPEPNLEDYK